jgi:ribosomal protein S18 acetylase RimI-like enzyme
MADHPLDSPAWNALTSLQAHHAVGSGTAWRFHPEIGPICATRSHDAAGLAHLAALVPDEGILATIETQPHPLPPGPFAARTHELGTFWGIRVDGRLAAMAGERMRMPGYGEVSAVCVHPDFRGRGLGEIVCRKAMATVAGAGLTPFLHAYADNHAALALYRKLGFEVRQVMTVTMFRRAV